MTKLATITPVIARTVLAVSALTTVLSMATVLALGEASLLMFTAFSLASGLYARQVLRADRDAIPAESHDRPLARLAA